MTQPQTPEDIKREATEYWNNAAAGWRKNDVNLRRSTAPVTRRLLDLAGIGAGMRVLDIASGTGLPGLPAAEAVGAGGSVLLTDQSPEMLAVARDNAAERGLTNVEFRLVDGESLDVPAASFDAATCRWGIMFMPEPARCLRRVLGALKPGGRFAVATWGPPEQNPFVTIPMGVLLKYKSDIPRPDPNAPGIFAFSQRNRLAAVFSEAGFTDVATEDMELYPSDFDSPDDYWEMTLRGGPVSRWLPELPEDVQQKVREEIIAIVTGADGRVKLKGYALLAGGRK